MASDVNSEESDHSMLIEVGYVSIVPFLEDLAPSGDETASKIKFQSLGTFTFQ